MRVGLTVDAVVAPMTGVGRYALELATRLPALGAKLSYLARGGVLTEANFSDRVSSAVNGTSRRGAVGRAVHRALNNSSLLGQAAHSIIGWGDRLFLQGLDFDLVHGAGYYLPPVGKAQAVVSFHDLSPLRFPQWHLPGRAARLASAMRQAAKRADWIITDSNAVRAEVLAEFDLPAHRVVAIPLGVDSAFRERGEDDCAEVLNQFGLRMKGYCLIVGTVEPRKNHECLVNAYARLPERLRKAYPLVIAGGPGWGADFARLAIDRGIREGWIKQLGYVPSPWLPSLYSGARLFVYPSLYEGFGLPLVEAMASGVPVIASNRSSVAETVAGAGELVDPEDVDGIRLTIERGFEDTEWRERARSKGLEVARRRTWPNCVRNTLDLYYLAVTGEGRASVSRLPGNDDCPRQFPL